MTTRQPEQPAGREATQAGMSTPGRTTRRRAKAQVPGPDVPVFVISVAAELTGLHPQTLRAYDRMGLVTPGRTGGGGRRYSLRDIEMLREVAELTSSGIGLEGVRRILELENQVQALRLRVAELEDELTTTQYTLHKTLTEPKSQNLPAVRSTSHAVTIWRRGRI